MLSSVSNGAIFCSQGKDSQEVVLFFVHIKRGHSKIIDYKIPAHILMFVSFKILNILIFRSMSNSNSVAYAPMLSDLEAQSIDAFLDGIEQVLHFEDALRPRERQEIIKLTRNNLTFVREALETIDEIPEVLPAYFDRPEIEERFALHEQVRNMEVKFSAMVEKLKDMRYRIGRQSWEDAITIYHSTKIASENRIPKASHYYNRMRKRFTFTSTNPENGEPTNEVVLNQDIVEDVPNENAQAA